MINELKIITMTRLALYDKHEGSQDRIANDYFRHDFIYRNNLGTRIAVGLGGLIILLIYWLRALLVNELDIFELNIQEHVTDSVFFLLAILAVYSLIGSIHGTRQYYLVQKRLAQYQAMVRQLERLEERSHRAYEDEEVLEDSTLKTQEDISSTRHYNPTPPIRTQQPPPEPVRRQRPSQMPPPYTRTRPRPSHYTAPSPSHAPRPSEETRPITRPRPSDSLEHTRPVTRSVERPSPPRPLEHTRSSDHTSSIDRSPHDSIDLTRPIERSRPKPLNPESIDE